MIYTLLKNKDVLVKNILIDYYKGLKGNMKKFNIEYSTQFTPESLCTILDKFGLLYEQQKRFPDCKDKRTLPFDIYLTDYHILIEFDGELHYYPIPRKSNDNGLEEFQKTQLHDKIKTDYCKTYSIPLIRIPYWERDDMEYYLFDQLVKHKVIEEIKTSA